MPKTKLEFQTFWDAYGLKRDKIAAERAWKRLPDKDRRKATAGIAAYREKCQQTGVAMMYAQNYLAHRRWEDEEEEEPVEREAPSAGNRDEALAEMDQW